MKKVAAILILFTVVTAFVPRPLQYVYIDTNPTAAFYHTDRHCSALKKALKADKGHYKLERVTLEEAINKFKKRPCPLCCKGEK